MKEIVIATRNSELALWQANFIKLQLESLYSISVKLLGITTKGDQIIDQPLSKIGGKGLFVKELEQALLDGRADIAVHSMKDVPMLLPKGLCLPVICKRADPRDVVVSRNNITLSNLAPGSKVGTSSARRREQLRVRFPHFSYVDIRGNVNTRLHKLEQGQFDVIVLAAAGLKRLKLDGHITDYLSVDECIPSPGQGAIGIECRADNVDLLNLLKPLKHDETTVQVSAERAMSRTLNGGCELPIAGFASVHDEMLHLNAMVAMPDGSQMVCFQASAAASEPESLGVHVARELLNLGADKILEQYGFTR